MNQGIMNEEKPVTKARQEQIAVGDDLTRASVDELEHRLEILAAEMVRVRAEIAAKQSHRDAAESVFKS